MVICTASPAGASLIVPQRIRNLYARSCFISRWRAAWVVGVCACGPPPFALRSRTIPIPGSRIDLTSAATAAASDAVASAACVLRCLRRVFRPKTAKKKVPRRSGRKVRQRALNLHAVFTLLCTRHAPRHVPQGGRGKAPASLN